MAFVEYFRCKGTKLTVAQVREAMIESNKYDDYFVNITFDELDPDALAIHEFGMFAEEEDGYTILTQEEA